MAISLVHLDNEIEFDNQFIKRSIEALTEDLLFLFERLNVRISLAAVFIEGQNLIVSRELLRKTCESLPLHFSEYLLPENIGLDEVVALVKSLNQENNIHGLIIDLPFAPDTIAKELFNFIDPLKNIRLNDADYYKLKEVSIAPHEEDILMILMMLEKTFDAAVEQVAKQRGNP